MDDHLMMTVDGIMDSGGENLSAREALYICSFPVIAVNSVNEQTEYVRKQLLDLKSVEKSRPVIIVVSLSGIRVYCSTTESVLMFHALKRISYATCYPEQCQFSFLAREPRTSNTVQHCHVFRLPSAQEAEELNDIVASAFTTAYSLQCSSVCSDAAESDELSIRYSYPYAEKSCHASNDRQDWRLFIDSVAFVDQQLVSPVGIERRIPIGKDSHNRHLPQRKAQPGELLTSITRTTMDASNPDLLPRTLPSALGASGDRDFTIDKSIMLGQSIVVQSTTRTRSRNVISPRTRPVSGKYCNDETMSIASSCTQLDRDVMESRRGLYQGPPTPLRFDSLRNKEASLVRWPANNLQDAAWYQPDMPREVALEVLSQQDIGAFIVRDSSTHPGCYALSVKVPKYENPSGISHYLITRTSKNMLKIKGLEKEWPNISALVTHHSVMREKLPCLLQLTSTNTTTTQEKLDVVDDHENFE